MKTFILSISLLFCTCLCNAQFALTPNGLVSSADESKRSVSYEFKGLMQNYLYSRILPFVEEHFTNARDHIDEKEPEYVIVEGIGINKIGLGAIKGNIIFNLSINIENNKLIYEVSELTFSNALLVESGDSKKDYIFNKDGEIQNQALKKQVEEYFNTLVDTINSYITTTAGVDWL